MKKSFLLLIMGTALLLSSCAAICTGTTDAIAFNSHPAGAKVYIDGLEVCKTPCRTLVQRSLSDKSVEFKLEGYETRVIVLSKEFNVVSIINLANVLGWGIDAATGALMKYDKKEYEIKLEEDKKTSLNNPIKIEINTKDKLVDIYVAQN